MAEPTYFGAHLASMASPTHPLLPPKESQKNGAANTYCVAIVGGGLVGMALALALKHHGIDACIFDARPRGAARHDPRTLALAHGSQQTFAWLGLWPTLAAAATPINTIHISQRGGFGRTRLTAAEQDVPALGQVIAAGHIASALDEALAAAHIEYHENLRIDSLQVDTEQARLVDAHGHQHHARLVVYAEGGITREDCGTPVQTRDYGQHALICEARITTSHHGTAYERFTPQGPLALLPCGADNNFSVVYTTSPADAQRLLKLSDADFLAALQAHFGQRLRFASASTRHIFPLGLRYRPNPVSARCVWLGNAAQTLHPVAGQGFNLALRDIRDLAHCLANQRDPGAPQVLTRYAQARRLDRAGVIGFTDSTVRLFSNDTPLLREARGLALLSLDLLPPLRDFVARRMMYGMHRGG